MPMLMESLLTVLMIIGLGHVLQRTGFVSAEQWKGFERVVYQILFPALIIATLARAKLGDAPVVAFTLTLLGPIALASALLLLTQGWLERTLGLSGPAFTSVFQGIVRWNSFVAIALAGTLHGAEGLALIALALVALVPFVNLVTAVALARHGSAAKPMAPLPFLRHLVLNPFMWSTLLGLVLLVIGWRLPDPVFAALDVMGRGALAGGLLMVGAGLDFGALRGARANLVASVVLRLCAVPLATLMVGKALGLGGTPLSVAMIAAAVPTAAASYILARQEGGDAPLMAGIITAQTMACAVTMPIMLILAG